MTGNGRTKAFSMGRTTERLCSAPALGMALMESLGIPEMIDGACDWDRSRRNMSQGQLAKAVCGTMFTHNKKMAMNLTFIFYLIDKRTRLFNEKIITIDRNMENRKPVATDNGNAGGRYIYAEKPRPVATANGTQRRR